VIRYLLDSSALWRILRDAALRSAWAEVISLGVIASCHPQRIELRRSARTLDEYEQMSEMFDALYPDAAVPKNAWRWIESAQYRLVRQGTHRALSAVNLLICATRQIMASSCSTTTRTL
jgi:predicted nucleic acid-binding protein